MADGGDIAVLGIALSAPGGVVAVHRAVVVYDGNEVSVREMTVWRGTRNDEARSLKDLVDTLCNVLDRQRDGAAEAIAVKRPEMPQGRPTTPYDQKARAEGAAMIAASEQGRRHFDYRTRELTRERGTALREQAAEHGDYPTSTEGQAAVAVACEAIAELLEERERDD